MQARIAEPSSSNVDAPEAVVMAMRADADIKLPSTCVPAPEHDAVCSCGALWSAATSQVATRHGVQSYIFHETKCQPVTVYHLLCTCGETLRYDGLQDAILNLNNVDLFTHEVLRRYILACLPILALRNIAWKSYIVWWLRHSHSLLRTGSTWTAAWSTLLHDYSTMPGTDLSVMQLLANKRGKYVDAIISQLHAP